MSVFSVWLAMNQVFYFYASDVSTQYLGAKKIGKGFQPIANNPAGCCVDII
ncbi:MAG: hypothetical protein HQM10_03640 [Candidatus Riflebacteria bacterium]|nr:hypothetical protein [Candidatus Riflebacteria bacterium]